MSTQPLVETVSDLARSRLQLRPIKESTYREYMATLRTLGLQDLPADSLNVAMLTSRLNRVLNENTRRKHAINLRACTGLPLPSSKPAQKVYQLPELEALHQALAQSTYAMWGFSMLYAGLRIGESCVKQPLEGSVLHVDRQRLPDGTIARAKTTGPVHVPPWFAEAYQDFDPERSANTVYVGIVRAGKKAKLSIKPHMLRHAFATNLVKAGATPEMLRRQMRHHDVTVSLRYYVQTREEDIASLMNTF